MRFLAALCSGTGTNSDWTSHGSVRGGDDHDLAPHLLAHPPDRVRPEVGQGRGVVTVEGEGPQPQVHGRPRRRRMDVRRRQRAEPGQPRWALTLSPLAQRGRRTRPICASVNSSGLFLLRSTTFDTPDARAKVHEAAPIPFT